MSEPLLEAARDRALLAKRKPDLEWAQPLVHGLADDVLALEARLTEAERERDDAQDAALDLIRVSQEEQRRLVTSAIAERDAALDALRRIAEPQSWERGDPAPFEIAREALRAVQKTPQSAGHDYFGEQVDAVTGVFEDAGLDVEQHPAVRETPQP